MSWYLNSGHSRHMTGKRSMFQSLEVKSGGDVKFGGNQKGKTKGFGTIGFGNSPSITNVLLVDGLAHNLLSISQLSDNVLYPKISRIFFQREGKRLLSNNWEFHIILDFIS